MQYRRPVGWGPSGKTCPRWLSHLVHRASVLIMPWLSSLFSLMTSVERPCQKLGQPEPESYLVSLSKRAVSQAAQWYMPFVLQSQYFPVKARSVPPHRHTAYCSGVSFSRHSSSVLSCVSTMPNLPRRLNKPCSG